MNTLTDDEIDAINTKCTRDWVETRGGGDCSKEALRIFARAIESALATRAQAPAAEQDARRYRWLSGGLRKTRRPHDAPFVFNPKRSRLYAVEKYEGESLDAAIDEDILDDMAQFVYEEALVEGDERFADPEFKFSEAFTNECIEKAKRLLAHPAGLPLVVSGGAW